MEEGAEPEVLFLLLLLVAEAEEVLEGPEPQEPHREVREGFQLLLPTERPVTA